MDNQPPIAISPRQLLTGLQPGEHGVVTAPHQPGKIVTQASRVGNVYYLVGPHFYHVMEEFVLEQYFQAAIDAADTPANAVSLLNKALTDCQVPAEGHVFACTSLDDALQTLAGLFAAYR